MAAGPPPGAAPAAGEGGAETGARLAALGQDIEALRQQEQATASLAGEVRKKVDDLEQMVRAVDPAQAAAAHEAAAEAASRIDQVDARVGALAAQFGALDQKLASRSDRQLSRSLAEALAASEALAAIDAGRPFAPEIATLAAGGDASLLAPLQKAAAGVAATARLQQDYAAVAGRLAVMQHQDEGVLDRLTASAARLVRIRPVGQDGAPAIAPEGTPERLGDLLQRGDLEAALGAWKALPQGLREEAATLGAALEARVSAAAAAQAALDRALAAIVQAQPQADGAATGKRRP